MSRDITKQSRSSWMKTVVWALQIALFIFHTNVLFDARATTAFSVSILQPKTHRVERTKGSAEDVVMDFLSTQSGTEAGKFHIQGWRWHTLALVRDLDRLEKLARKLQSSELQSTEIDLNSIKRATYHVVGFNMKGLHRIESELFFPWLKERFRSGKGLLFSDKQLMKSLVNLIENIEDDRLIVQKMGESIMEQSQLSTSSFHKSREGTEELLSSVVQTCSKLKDKTAEIMNKEEKYLVPSVARLIPEKEQKSFNNKVIAKLGILDSRIHLVGMYDAVQEKADQLEMELFEEVIPYLPRKMIPRWRRNLYNPQAGMLEIA